MPKINHEDPIREDKPLINLAKQALWDKKLYGSGDATLETVRQWLHADVPLLRWLKVTSPRQLRETNRKYELMMALQVINNDIKPRVFFDHIKKHKEELAAI